MARPKRRASRSPTARPMRVEPVAESDRHARVVNQGRADLGAADQQRQRPSGASPNVRAARAKIACTASAVSGAFSDGFQITLSPQTSASAAFHDHTATGKLNAEMMPTGPIGCHCSVSLWSGRSEAMREAVKLARQADREIADVDHLLHFAQALALDLADLQRDEPAERLFVGAQLFAEQPHQLAATRGGDVAPVLEGGGGAAISAAGSAVSGSAPISRAVDGGADAQRAARERGASDVKRDEEVGDFGGVGHGGGLRKTIEVSLSRLVRRGNRFQGLLGRLSK